MQSSVDSQCTLTSRTPGSGSKSTTTEPYGNMRLGNECGIVYDITDYGSLLFKMEDNS